MKAGFTHDHLHQTVEDVCSKGRLPATAESDSQSLRGGDGRRLHFEKHSSWGSRPFATVGQNREGWGSPGPAVVFLGQRSPIRYPLKPGAQGARVCHRRGRPGPPSGRLPRLRGLPPTQSPAPLHGRAERRPPTDLRPPGPGRRRPTPRGPDTEVSRRLLGCSATGRADQHAAPPCGPDVQCAKRKGGLAPDTPRPRRR